MNKPITNNKAYLFLFCLAMLGVLYAIHALILQRFANSADEFNYLFTARLFAQGEISAPAHPLQEFFSPFYILTHQERVFSLFPPGWPSLLALGELVGGAGWVNPLLAAVTLAVFWFFCRELADARIAWISVLLLGLSPFFLLNSASFYAHPSCLLAVLVGFWGMRMWESHARWYWPLLSGAAVGWSFTIRELTTTALFFVPLLVFFCTTRDRWRFVGLFLLGSLPFAGAYLCYNAALTGKWFYPIRFLKEGEWLGFGTREIRVFDYVRTREHGMGEALVYLLRNVGRLLIWTVPGLPLFAVWGWWSRRGERWACLLALACLCLPFAYLFYPAEGAMNYGPRFYYEMLGFLALFAGWSLYDAYHFYCNNPRNGFARAIFPLVVILCMLGQHGWLGYFHSQRIYERRTLFRLVEHRDLRNAVVIVGAPSGDMTQGDLIRNPPHWDRAEVLYAWDLGRRNMALGDAFPQKRFYLFGKNRGNGIYYLKLLNLQQHY